MAYDYLNLQRFTKSQINGLTKALISQRFGTYESSKAWDAIFAKAEQLGLEIGYCGNYYGERLDFKTPRKITREQTDFGRKWLKDYFFKKNGTPRSGKRTEYIGQGVLDIAKSVSRFEFVGVAILASQGWYPNQAVPIYRAYSRDGSYFDYSPIHWGTPIVDDVVRNFKKGA